MHLEQHFDSSLTKILLLKLLARAKLNIVVRLYKTSRNSKLGFLQSCSGEGALRLKIGKSKS